MEITSTPHEGKNRFIEVDGQTFERLPIRTHLITKNDDIVEVAEKYGRPVLSQPGDILFLSRKMVACAQGRAIPLEEIHPRRLAIDLSDRIPRDPYRIGPGMPESMEMALQEVGTLRILFAAWMASFSKKIDTFYKVAGDLVRHIDAPRYRSIPPYHHYVILTPLKPDLVCRQIKERLGYEVCIVNADDFGASILGASSDKIDREQFARILCDNPMGQEHEQTPLGLLRKVK